MRKEYLEDSEGDLVSGWEELAVLSQKGDKRAYSKLLTEIAPYIKLRLSSGLANFDWVEDVVQDVLISVHKSLGSYSAERPFKPWLNAIIHYRKTDFLRVYYKNRDINRFSKDNADMFGYDVTINAHAGELQDIEKALAMLPEKQQKLVRLMKIEGYSAAEVAAKTGMSVTAVKVSVHRAINKIRESFDVQEPD